MANLWGQVVELENILAGDPGSDALFARLGKHQGFLILVNDQNQPIDVTVPSMGGRSAVAFTAPDRCEAFMAQRTEAERARLHKVPISGAVMFRHLQGYPDMAGVLLNLGTNGVVVAKANFARICALA